MPIIALLFFLSFNTYGQTLLQGSSSIKFHELDTSDFKIIYPKENKETALKVLSLLHFYKRKVEEDYSLNTPKLILILRKNSAVSNGFVTLAPKRSEWFMAPSLSRTLGATEWYNTLSVHEYRHVVQFEKMKSGFNKALHTILGDTGLSFGMALSAPPWYYEGDAVVTETALTKGGRGRSSEFSLRLRSYLTERDEKLDFERLFMPNYNEKLPEVYEYGYFSFASLRNLYGKNKVSELITESAKDSYWPFTFYNSYPLVISKTFKKFHEETLKNIKESLKEEEKNKTYLKSELILEANKKNGFTDMDNFYVADNGFYFIKKDFDQNSTLYFKPNNSSKIRKIRSINYSPYNQSSDFTSEYFIYEENQMDIRYQLESVSDLFLIHLKTGKRFRLSKNKRLFNPRFSQDGKSFWAIKLNKKSKYNLVKFDLKGNLENSISFTDLIPSAPNEDNNGNLYFLIQREDGKRNIQSLNNKTGEIKELTPYSWNQISNLKLFNNSLYYERDYRGKIEIFKLDLKTLKETLLTSSKLSSRSPFIKDQKLYFLNYTHYGYELRVAEKTADIILTTHEIENSNLDHIATDFIKDSEEAPEIDKTLERDEKKYSEIKNLFNFHSWTLLPLPGSITLEGTSTNDLNTLSLNIGYSYSDFEKSNSAHFNINYMKYFPVFSLNTTFSQRKKFEDQKHEVKKDAWDETTAEALITLPFNLNFDLYDHSLILQGGEKLIETSSRERSSAYEGNNNTLQGPIMIFNYNLTKKLALRDINPSYGIKLKSLNQRVKNKRGNKDQGSQDIFSTKIFLPSFFKHDGFVLSHSSERQKSFTNYRFPTFSGITRGSSFHYFPTMKLTSLDYFFPISYPDFSLSRWYYLSRIFASVFYDYGELKSNNKDYLSRSYGLDLYFESRFLRILPLTFGLRGAKSVEDTTSTSEVFLQTAFLF